MSLFTGGIGLASALGGAGLGLWGKSKEASAAERGAELQAKATQEALDFTKAEKAKQEVAAAPYLSLGQMAAGRLPGLAATGPSMGAPRPYTTQPQATQGVPLAHFNAPPMGAQPRLVTVQAPTGETMQLPQDRAQAAISRGAKIVG